MKIATESLVEGAKKAKGLAVIIDVFRAFTVAAYIMNNGAKKIIPVGSLEDAFRLKRNNPEFVLMGERNRVKVRGFDYGNSPYEIQNIDFKEKIVIQTTTAGTQGIVNAKNADDIILGSFVNIKATIDFIKKLNPELVTLVCMGDTVKSTVEDELCANYIKAYLEGNKPAFTKIRNFIKYKNKTSMKFSEDDFNCAMAINKFNFALRVKKENNQLYVTRVLN